MWWLNKLWFLTNKGSFAQQENDEVQTEISTVVKKLLDDNESVEDNSTFSGEQLSLSVQTAPIMAADNRVNEKIRSRNKKY